MNALRMYYTAIHVVSSCIQWRALAVDDSRFAMKIQQVALEGHFNHQ